MRFLRPLLIAGALLGLILNPALGASKTAVAPAPVGPPDHHVLQLRFDPASSMLTGSDRVTTPWAKILRFQLHDGLSFTATCSGRKLAGPGSASQPAKQGSDDDADAAWHELRVPRECADAAGLVTIDFQLAGKINDPIEQEPSLHFVTGDRTSGLISPKGIFLAGGTYWYPQTGRLETYDFTADLPTGWSVASQGSRQESLTPAPEGIARQRHVSVVPADGLAMSAGPYVVTKRQHGSIEVATFFFDDAPDRAKLFLDAAETEIDRLAGMAGPYPYPKFDIVENFFTTGYGFPAYTLLGSDVIHMGARALRPGYLDHEIAHVWFGNYVYVDVEGGNWCEGLVSYLTNYLGSARGGDDDALNARRRVSQRYSVDVPAAKDFAPSAFVTKTDDIGASIGYGKVSMVFHVLRHDLGDEMFWKGVRMLVQDAGGRRGNWADIENAFESASGKQLDAFFAQWIGRAGLPELALENVTQATGGAGPVTGEIVQAGTPWTLNLEVELLLADGTRTTQVVPVSSPRTRFELPATSTVSRVSLDPGFHVPRRLRPADLPASLARTLAGDGKPTLIVYPNVPKDAGDELAPFAKRSVALKALADMAADDGRLTMASNDVAEAEFSGSSILAIGTPEENVATERFAPAIRQALGIDLSQKGSFRAGDRRWRAEGQSILVSIPHPERAGATVTVFIPNGDAATADGRKIFYYGWDQWAAIDGGLAKQRGTTWPEDSATSVKLADLAAPNTAAARMLADVAKLADPRLEGREAGTAGEREATAIVGESMVSSGLTPLGTRAYFDPFGFDLFDVPLQPVLMVVEDKQALFTPVMPGHAWLKPPEDFAVTPLGGAATLGALTVPVVVPAPRGLVFVGSAPNPSFAGLDLTDAFGVVLDAPDPDGTRPPTDDAIRRIRDWLEQARLHEAVGLIVIRPQADWPAPPPLAAYATQVAPSMAKRQERAVAEGGHRGAERAAAGERARAEEFGIDRSLPLVFGGKQLAEALEKAGAFTRGRRTWDGQSVNVRFNLRAERISDRNVIGLARGEDQSKPVVLVQAHHDSIGELADGRGCECAVDNASGVAVLLEVARRLGAKPAASSVLFVTTGGEEWGLQGSRSLASRWSKSDPVIKAVVNIDSVGQSGQPLHVIGRSKWPQLATVIESAGKSAGLEIGADIDKYAYAWGSDHWPWAQKGIPSVDLFQADYAVLNTGRDELPLVDGPTLSKLADAVEAAVRDLSK